MTGNLPLPKRRQREVLYLPTTGHSAVLGTAGSGKTTRALYRAAYLSIPGLVHSGRTLLLTFNNVLVAYLNHLKPPELSSVTVEPYYKFARGYLNARKKMCNEKHGTRCICSDSDIKRRLVLSAKDRVSQKYNPHVFFNRSDSFSNGSSSPIQGSGKSETAHLASVAKETMEGYSVGHLTTSAGDNHDLLASIKSRLLRSKTMKKKEMKNLLDEYIERLQKEGHIIYDKRKGFILPCTEVDVSGHDKEKPTRNPT
jgi:hypothetical protein